MPEPLVEVADDRQEQDRERLFRAVYEAWKALKDLKDLAMHPDIDIATFRAISRGTCDLDSWLYWHGEKKEAF